MQLKKPRTWLILFLLATAGLLVLGMPPEHREQLLADPAAAFLSAVRNSPLKGMVAGSPETKNAQSESPDAYAVKPRELVAQEKHCPAFPPGTLSRNTQVIVAGAYSGKPLHWEIDNSNHTATGFEVLVHSDAPVALLLSAYEPSVWSVSWTEGTKIEAVYLTGYHTQQVAGLPHDVPVINASYPLETGCGRHHLSSGHMEDWVEVIAKRVFDRGVTRMEKPHKQGIITIQNASRPAGDYIFSTRVSPEDFRVSGRPRAGAEGLKDAVDAGVLEPLTDAAWPLLDSIYAAEARRRGFQVQEGARGDGSLWISNMPSLSTAYLVRKPFVVPAGLYGADSATFFVLPGVPAPQGILGHSTVYDFGTMSCKGTGCPATH